MLTKLKLHPDLLACEILPSGSAPGTVEVDEETYRALCRMASRALALEEHLRSVRAVIDLEVDILRSVSLRISDALKRARNEEP